MRTALRWVLAAASIVLVICLLGWARGDDHHRGDEIGSSLGTTANAVAGF